MRPVSPVPRNTVLPKAVLGLERYPLTHIKTAAENEATKPRMMTYFMGERATPVHSAKTNYKKGLPL
jgi:hypothetical protein